MIEVKNTAFAMGAFKAPGPDRLQAHFFQSKWQIVGDKIYSLVEEIFTNPSKAAEINQTTVVLFPKTDFPESLKELRPISLCNVSLKIVTKLIAERLKGVIDKLVSQEQCSFIANRSSCDNIIIAQEAIHTMRQKGRRKGYVAVKVDMEKAYDRLDWNFIRDTLEQLKIAGHIIEVIMACISTTSMSVLWNGEEGPIFSPSRGIRQGDPLSPYIFVLCMERLSHLIKAECEAKRWKLNVKLRDGSL